MRKRCFLIIVAVTLFRVMLFGDEYWELTGYNECANRIVINEDDVLFASDHLGLKVSYDLGETWESVEEPPITSTSSRVLYLNNSNLYYAERKNYFLHLSANVNCLIKKASHF